MATVVKIAPSRMRLIDENGFATPEFFRILQAIQTRTGGVAGVITASDVALVPVGDVAATDVQTGFSELSAEKATVAALNLHTTNISNPHATTAAQVGAPAGSGSSTGTNTGDQFTATTASRLLGRGSASAGAAQEITLGTNLSMSGTTVNAAGPSVSPLMNLGGKNFNGSSTYLSGNALTGVADGKSGTFFCVVRFNGAASASESIWASTSGTIAITRTATGGIAFIGRNSALTTILAIGTSGTPCSAAGTYVIAASWDLSTAGTGRLYVNDASSYLETLYTNDTIDYTVAQHSIGATVAGAQLLAGDIYSVWFDFTQRLELSTDSVRRKFTDANGVLTYLGAAGQLPTGSAPGVYQALDDVNAWHLNRGSLQATSWTQNGANATATTQLSGQFAPLMDYGRAVTITADYTVNRTDRLVINNKGSACVLTLPDAAGNQCRELRVLNIGGAFATTSATSNVVPLAGGAAGTALLAATDGVGCLLKANGASWQIVDN